jgi:hypothetical protein
MKTINISVSMKGKPVEPKLSIMLQIKKELSKLGCFSSFDEPTSITDRICLTCDGSHSNTRMMLCTSIVAYMLRDMLFIGGSKKESIYIELHGSFASSCNNDYTKAWTAVLNKLKEIDTVNIC